MITAADVQAVRRLRVAQPLAILTELERHGWLRLPPPKPVPQRSRVALAALPAEKIVAGPLRQYRPLRWELVGTPAQRRQWRALLAHHHYWGAPELVAQASSPAPVPTGEPPIRVRLRITEKGVAPGEGGVGICPHDNPDSQIAAIALARNLALVTRNGVDFPEVPTVNLFA